MNTAAIVGIVLALIGAWVVWGVVERLRDYEDSKGAQPGDDKFEDLKHD